MGLVGTKAPKFSANAVVNGGDTVSEFSLEQFIDKNYVILFFYPKDFTFVCPSELHAFQEKLDEFKKEIVKLLHALPTPLKHIGGGYKYLKMMVGSKE